MIELNRIYNRAWADDDGYMLRTREEWFKEKDIGKTVFLTREEAEEALKEAQQTRSEWLDGLLEVMNCETNCLRC